MDVIGCGPTRISRCRTSAPFGIGVEIQLPDLGGAGKASGAAHRDSRRLVGDRPGRSRAAARLNQRTGDASAGGLGRREINTRSEQADLDPRCPNLLSD